MTKLKYLGVLLALGFIWLTTVPTYAQGGITPLPTPSVQGGIGVGSSVSIDGTTAVVGLNSTSNGPVNVYTRNTTEWILSATLPLPRSPQTGFTLTGFGSIVALDGDTIVAPAQFVLDSTQGNVAGFNQIVVYIRSGSAWIIQTQFDPRTGAAADSPRTGIGAIAVSGNQIVVGAARNNTTTDGTGAAYVYTRSGEYIATLAPNSLQFGDLFGIAVAIQNETIVVGAINVNDASNFYPGAAFVFGQNQGGPNKWGLLRKLVGSDPAGFEQFGRAVAIDNDRVVVGSYSRAGSAYLFERNRGGTNRWGLVTKLVESRRVPSTQGAAEFSVDISGNRVLLGVVRIDVRGANPPGTVGVFTNQNGIWTLATRLNVQDNGSARFGAAVGLSGNQALVGAPGEGGGIGVVYSSAVP